MFWMMSPPPPENEMHNQVAIVHVRGPIDHHDAGDGDSYDAITRRVQEAHDSDARTVVMCIDSPGGVVSGLNQCVHALRGIADASGKDFIAYVGEMATSAAYALCCSCDEVITPPSGICGSIGVISTMASEAAADAAHGYDYRLLTSGSHKADGHPHAPITNDATKAEQGRVDKLAMQFFNIASKARGISVDTIRSYQAGLFLGKEAVRAGLADSVMGYRTLLETLNGF
jgi:capsid assembly protease